MDDLLSGLGFTPKEITVYRYLLANGIQTASAIATACGEKRANTYVLLEGLITKGVVVANDETPVRKFSAAHPSALQRLVREAQLRQQQLASSLTAQLPQLTAAYNLASDKPGVVHLQGKDGFMALLQDMVSSTTDVQLIASNNLPADSQTLQNFRRLLVRRKNAGVKTRALFHHNPRQDEFRRIFAERGIELRFLGQTEFTGEVAIYEDNVAFTVYEPSLVVTVITNPAIAATMRTIFEELWEKAQAE